MTIRGKIVAKMLCAFSKNILTKIEIAVSAVVKPAQKLSCIRFEMYRFGWYKGDVQEKYVARE